jgi:putative ABC transport system ATP-binding protein
MAHDAQTADRSPVVAAVEHVAKVYHRNKAAPPVHALRDVSLSIPRGQYCAIMGHSGSGKSTLMNILGCLDRPTNGRYLLDGHDVSTLDDESISRVRGRTIGFVFQAFNLIPQLTIQGNVEVPLFYQDVPKPTRQARAMEALDRVGLAERVHHRPNELSGGQMQRVAIARALVTRPALLLADEPTGNLDTATGSAILDLFDELRAEGLTIIMVTHEPDVAARCQRVVWLRDGNIEKDDMQTPQSAGH